MTDQTKPTRNPHPGTPIPEPTARPAPRVRRAARAGLPIAGALPPPREPVRSGRGRRPLVLFGVAVLALTVALAGRRLVEAGVFRVESVAVRGAGLTDEAQIRDASGLRGLEIWQVEAGEAAARVEAIPGIKRARIETRWPDRVTIVVEERLPAAVWRGSGGDMVVDDEGVVLEAGVMGGMPAVHQRELVTVLGPGERVDRAAVQLALVLGRQLPEATGQRVSRLEYSAAGGLDVVTDRGIRVRLGDGQDLDYKLAMLHGIAEQAKKERLAVNEVDLRHGAQAAVR